MDANYSVTYFWLSVWVCCAISMVWLWMRVFQLFGDCYMHWSCLCNSGNNKKLKLTGRPSDVAGVLATGKLYTLGEQVLAFFPQVCVVRLVHIELKFHAEALRFSFHCYWPHWPSVLWHCWLDVRKSICPVEIEWWDVDVVICLQWGADCLHMVQLMPLHPNIPSSLASFKPRLVLPFWYQLTQVVLEKRPLNVRQRKVIEPHVSICLFLGPFVSSNFWPSDLWPWFFACVWVMTVAHWGLKIMVALGWHQGMISIAARSVWHWFSIEDSLSGC